MVSIVVVTRAALLIGRRASTWTVEEHLGGRSPQCGGRPAPAPTRVCTGGTAHGGLFRPRQRPELGTSRTGPRPPDDRRS